MSDVKLLSLIIRTRTSGKISNLSDVKFRVQDMKYMEKEIVQFFCIILWKQIA